MPPEHYDAIVIGAGHNGLTCAAYLARAGHRVLVLESRPLVGGLCTTEETVPGAPGFRMNTAALDTVFTNSERSVLDELDLRRYGLRFAVPDPWGSYLNPDGASIALWRSRPRTAAEIARYSRKDAEAFETLTDIFADVWTAAVPYLQDHPTRPSARTVAEVVRRLAKGRRSLRPAVRILLGSVEQVIEERFESTEVKALLANLASWSMMPLSESGSGGVLAMCVSYFTWGATRPIGGSGAFTRALADCVVAHGGQIRCAAPVGQVLVSQGAAHGVELVNGERLSAGQVIGAVDPTRLLGELVPAEQLPERTRAELRGLGNLRWNLAPFMGDVALARRPKLRCRRDECLSGLLFLGPTLEYVKRAQALSAAGLLPAEVPQWSALPSYLDRSQVPEGSEGDTLYVALATTPAKLTEEDWSQVGDKYLDHILDVLDDHAPGLKDAVIGTNVRTPDDYAERASGGNLYHADMSMSQLGPWRPVPSLAGYRTPVERLWHTASGAHPVGGLTGWSGRTTARTVARALAART